MVSPKANLFSIEQLGNSPVMIVHQIVETTKTYFVPIVVAVVNGAIVLQILLELWVSDARLSLVFNTSSDNIVVCSVLSVWDEVLNVHENDREK